MPVGLSRELMSSRAARELKEGMYVNLGFGLPVMVSDFIPVDMEVVLHSENGILRYGPISDESNMDIDLVNAAGMPVTLLPGASFFHHADSFAMIRGGHIDLTILGAYQVSEKGDLSNWKLPDQPLGAIGGAMDLVCGAKRVIVIMEHTTSSGEPRIVKQCTYPLTGKEVVNTIVTNLAVIEVTRDGLVLKEAAPGVTIEDIRAVTEPSLIVSSAFKVMEL